MTDNIGKRVRKVDVDNTEPEQLDQIGFELGKKLGQIGDEAAAKMNEILKIYGLSAKVAVQLSDKDGNVLS